MKKVALFVISLLIISMSPAGIAQLSAQDIQLSNSTITVIIPNDKAVDFSKITQIKFDNQWGGNKNHQDKLLVKNVTNNSFNVERRTDNGYAGSGIIYTVNYSIENNNNDTIVKFQPIDYKTYREGLILRFPVPNFTEQDLTDYIVKQPVYYNLEMDSQYNTESTYSNFVRRVEKIQFQEGERDPVTGKIFTDKFVIPYKDKKIFFTLETYPYHNGSKAVVHLVVPGSITSDNVVDFGLILKDIRKQLEDVAEVQAPKANEAAVPSTTGSIEDKLAELKTLLQKGVITQQEYDAKRKQLIDQL